VLSLGQAAAARIAAQPVHLAGEVGLVRARPVVAGAARADGQAESHRLQAARIVARDLEALAA
jgi:hypothetical protein